MAIQATPPSSSPPMVFESDDEAGAMLLADEEDKENSYSGVLSPSPSPSSSSYCWRTTIHDSYHYHRHQLSDNHSRTTFGPSSSIPFTVVVVVSRDDYSRCSGGMENRDISVIENKKCLVIGTGKCSPSVGTNDTAGELVHFVYVGDVARNSKKLSECLIAGKLFSEAFRKNVTLPSIKTPDRNEQNELNISDYYHESRCISNQMPSNLSRVHGCHYLKCSPVHIVILHDISSRLTGMSSQGRRCISNPFANQCSSSILCPQLTIDLYSVFHEEISFPSCIVVDHQCLETRDEDSENVKGIEIRQNKLALSNCSQSSRRVLRSRTFLENRCSHKQNENSPFCLDHPRNSRYTYLTSSSSSSSLCPEESGLHTPTRRSIPPSASCKPPTSSNPKSSRIPTYGWVLLLLLLSGLHERVAVRASEFPDRECCDSAPPPPPHYHTTTSTTPVPQPKPSSTSTIVPTLHSLVPTSSVSPTGDGAVGVRNCLLARQQCADDPSCRSVLEIIPRVCGPEDVACSTVTVDKCLAALRFLGGFPYFQPTCLCRERHLDKDCNVFREFIFDHPCMFVENKDKSPYQVHALPLCEYALNECEHLPGCINLYQKFRDSCKVRDDQCRMEDTNECLASWNKLKQSPMFGCVCPVDHQKRKCQRIFKIVHNNPCVVNVIPHDNSSLHAAVDTQIQNPLVVDHRKGGGGAGGGGGGAAGSGPGRRQNASRAADVLGQPSPIDPHASATSPSGPVPMLHSTCQTALVGCNGDQSCRRLLDPVLAVCDNQCNREACMNSLQTFYRNVDSKWAIEVAFCLCKKSSLTADECLSAQEKLHPSCARKPKGKVPMLCNRLATACKEDSNCRHRLEFYEQACAVDSDTRRCAGSTAECRRALLGILGTQLRNLCTCSASDPMETYTCLDWQRILWFNPCVVEAQTDYHREMLAGTKEEITTTPNIIITHITTGVISEPVQQNGDHDKDLIKQPVVIHPVSNTTHIYAPTYRAPKVYPPTPPVFPPTSSTTTTPPPTTLPPKRCEKRHTNGDRVDYIEEGWGKRFYKDEECSELCLCHAEEKLACSVLECVEAKACQTKFAVYNHAAPAYQASRGECFCYSGSFICVRPPLEKYKVDNGVFLFLGYSKAEENLLRPYTKVPLVDAALSKLKDLVRESASPMNGRDRRVSSQDSLHTKTECRLETVVHVGENIIMQATLEEFDDLRDNMTVEMLNQEKDACENAVAEVSKMINTHEKSVREDMALSVLILAEMQVHVPDPSATVTITHCPLLMLTTTLALLLFNLVQHTLLAS